jgi:hypothetical protein
MFLFFEMSLQLLEGKKMYIIEEMLNIIEFFYLNKVFWLLTLNNKFYVNPKTLYHRCDQFCITFIFIYVKSYSNINK